MVQNIAISHNTQVGRGNEDSEPVARLKFNLVSNSGQLVLIKQLVE